MSLLNVGAYMICSYRVSTLTLNLIHAEPHWLESSSVRSKLDEWRLELRVDGRYDGGRHQTRILRTLTTEEVKQKGIITSGHSVACRWASKKGIADHIEAVPVMYLGVRQPQRNAYAMVVTGDKYIGETYTFCHPRKAKSGETMAVLEDRSRAKLFVPMSHVCGIERVKTK